MSDSKILEYYLHFILMRDRFLMGVFGGLYRLLNTSITISQEGNMNGLVISGVGARQAA